MKHVQVNFNPGFTVLGGNERSQAAVMVLGPGESTGGPDNRHAGSDQWPLSTDRSTAKNGNLTAKSPRPQRYAKLF